jgi:transposase
MPPLPDILPDDPAALKAIILAQREEMARARASALALEALVQALRIQIAKLRRQRFGPSSERIGRELEQLQLTLEDVEVAVAANDASGERSDAGDAQEEPGLPRAEPRRRGKPRLRDDAPRERIVLDPGDHCPDCGGPLRLLGEDLSEVLEFVAAKLKVIETRRPRKSCRLCERIVQEPAPSRPIPRGMAGPALLAHVLVSKFDDHLPLYRQGEIFARMGADIPRSTLIDWCGQAVATLRPLTDLIRAEVLRSDRLHADDTPIRVLDPGRRAVEGKTRGVKEGRIWVYLRDDRPWGGSDPPAVTYFFSPDRRGEHPQAHLKGFEGVLQADAYGGFKKLYEPGAEGHRRIREAACWAHLRRAFHDVWKSTGSPIAFEALERIGALYDIEREITGRPGGGAPPRPAGAEPCAGGCLPGLVRGSAPAPSQQGRPADGDALLPQTGRGLLPVPRGRARGDRQQSGRAGDPADLGGPELCAAGGYVQFAGVPGPEPETPRRSRSQANCP